MSIIFYSMGSRCGFCVKAEALLKQQIESGDVVKKSASEAGKKFSGFPAFESTKTGKTHTGLPKSYEQLAKKLGHTEHYGHAHAHGKGHHNPYNYNAMPVRAKPPLGPGSSPPYRGQCNNKSPSDLQSCCANACNNNTQTACYMECEESGPLPTNCNSPPKGMSRTECCEKGGRAGGVGHCPPGCNDEGGACLPASGGGGGDPSTKCGTEYSDAGCYNWDAGDNTCEYMGPHMGSHCQYKSCTQCFAAHGHGHGHGGGGGGGGLGGGGGGGGGGGPSPGSGSCWTASGSCDSNQYCSIASNKCTNFPSTWTSDFYNSSIKDMTNGSSPLPSKKVATCVVNGTASPKGCDLTDPANPPQDLRTCITTVAKNCANDSNYYPNSPVKKGGPSPGPGPSRGPSVLEIVLIVVGVLGLLGLVGFLAYRAKKK